MSLYNENREKNQIFNDRLRSSGIVDSQLLASFDEAYNYDSASTINWLTSKLKILNELVEHGGSIQVDSSKKISNVDELKGWIRERYPDIAESV